MRTCFCAATLLVGVSGCASVYQQATVDFADTMATATKSMRDQVDTSVELCRKHRHVRWLLTQIDPTWTRGPHFADAGLAPPPVPSTSPGNEGTPEERISKLASALLQEEAPAGACAVADQDRDAFDKAVSVLSRYADGLKAVAAGAKYDATSLKDATEAVTGIKQAGLSSDAQTAISGIGGLLDGLVQAILNSYADQKIRDALAGAEPAVNRLISLLQAMVVYDLETLRALQTDSQTLLDRARDALGLKDDGKAKAGDALVFYQFAARLQRDCDRIYERQRALNGVLSDLRDAHHELRDAAKDGAKPDLSQLQGYVKRFLDLADEIHKLRALTDNGGS